MYTLCCTVQNVATLDTFPVDMQHLTDTVKLSILVHPYFHFSFFLELRVSKNKEKCLFTPRKFINLVEMHLKMISNLLRDFIT